jgi:hypothetical protein
MFLPREPSRNGFNNKRESGYFCEHYQHIFASRPPHRDTVFDVPNESDNGKLECVKKVLMSRLFEQKHLRVNRLSDKYYMIAVDATGLFGFDHRHCPHCLTRKSKNGKITYFHYVLEAKSVTEDGHALSLCGERIENPSGEFNKQDCERKAFLRLADKLKKHYPRLPVCILADDPYPYEGAFRLCEDKGRK